MKRVSSTALTEGMSCLSVYIFLSFRYIWEVGHTANALYQKFETNIPRNETARPHSQLLHSCICERFHDRSANAIQQNWRTDCGNKYIAHRYYQQKQGTRTHSFISANICFEFSVQCIDAFTNWTMTQTGCWSVPELVDWAVTARKNMYFDCH